MELKSNKTLVGQYIIKNLVLVAGALVIAGHYQAKPSLESKIEMNPSNPFFN